MHALAEGFERDWLTSLPSLLALVWLACYLLSGSIDYRLILALPALIGCSAILTAEPGLKPPARAALALILLGVITGWFAPCSHHPRCPSVWIWFVTWCSCPCWPAPSSPWWPTPRPAFRGVGPPPTAT